MSSLLFGRASTDSNSTAQGATRITLVDNTAPSPLTPSADHSRSGSPSPPNNGASQTMSGRSLGDGKREILRKAIAERRYRRWSMNPDSDAGSEREELEEAPDERAAGVIVRRDSDEEVTVDGSGSDKANLDGAADGGVGGNSQRGRQGGRGRGGEMSSGVGGTGQIRRKGGNETEIAEIDVLYENQRGAFFCGIPLFSSKSLLNFDPAPWQNGLFHDSAVSITDAQLPDPSWVWDWKTWYVDMTADVDEEGWAYSFSFSPLFAWHGNHVWFHSFVRRRRWLRKRIKLPQRAAKESDAPASETLDGSVERAGHGMNDDYFTIHSRKNARNQRRSVLDGSDWGADYDSDDEVEVRDVGTLIKIVKKARLDREKIEAIMGFVEDGGEEVAYLAEKIPTLMSMMIFQASRRQLLAYIVQYMEQYEAGETPTITITGSPLPPVESRSPTPVSTASSQQRLKNTLSDGEATAPSRTLDTVMEGKNARDDDLAARSWKVEHLRNAANAADQEVKKMEFWSDIKGVARKGESLSAEGEEGWDELGISGASTGNEKIFGSAGTGGGPEKRERVDLKGKGKSVAR